LENKEQKYSSDENNTRYKSGNEVVQSNSTEKCHATEIDLDLQDIEGIGPTTAKKLKEAGITSVLGLAVTSAEQLAVDISFSKDTAAAFIVGAQNLLRESNVLEKEFVTADFVLKERKSMLGVPPVLSLWMVYCWVE
jgi:hypothetical protein